jgi:hypothetical protein
MYQLSLPEGASPRIEALECELCVIDEMEHIGARMAALEAEFGHQTATYLRLDGSTLVRAWRSPSRRRPRPPRRGSVHGPSSA